MSTPILQLRIELLYIEPLIWRRLQVPGDGTFWDLHVAIQGAFVWNDTYLHEFRPRGEPGAHPRFGMPWTRSMTTRCCPAGNIAWPTS